jgi:hypothetical protein
MDGRLAAVSMLPIVDSIGIRMVSGIWDQADSPETRQFFRGKLREPQVNIADRAGIDPSGTRLSLKHGDHPSTSACSLFPI